MGQRAKTFVGRMWPCIKEAKTIIDIGCGNGEIAALLLDRGKFVTPVDAAKHRFVPGLKVVIYDGKKLPFPDGSFEVALLSTVLHHTSDPELILTEASRMAKNVLVVETSYTNWFQKFYTVLVDSIANLQLNFQWNSYKSDREWKELFAKLGFKISAFSEYTDKTLGVTFLHYQYFLSAEIQTR